MVYIFLADGFEETEALTPVDMLRRASVEVVIAGVGKKEITGSHGITVTSDITAKEASPENACMVILPGGMPGTLNLQADEYVQKAVDCMMSAGKYIAAICAAPIILGEKGLLKGKKATCYTGFEDRLLGASYTGDAVCTDGRIITARGAGVALDFALELVRVLKGEETAQSLRKSILCR